MAFVKNMDNSFQMGSKFYPSSTISNILGELSQIDDVSKKSSKLEFYVHLMEAEMVKMDGFKGQLPICMQLLKNGIEMLKAEKLKWNGNRVQPVLGEFMSLKNDGIKGQSSQMTSTSVISKSYPRETKDYGHESQIPKMPNSLENSGGAFMSHKRQPGGVEVNNGKPFPFPINHGLTFLAPSHVAAEVEEASIDDGQAKKPKLEEPPERKQRRCWSPELHNRFVNVLRQLGGAKVATPKKIMELMQVEGLTSEQVKSHLQKYRIHLRKLASPGPRDLSDDPSLKLSLAIGS